MGSPVAFDVSKMRVVMESSGVEVRCAPAGDSMTLLWLKCPRGFDFAPALQGLPHNMCCCEHWGTMIEGSMEITTHDGKSLTLSAGQAFHLLPGHMPSFPVAWPAATPRWRSPAPRRAVRAICNLICRLVRRPRVESGSRRVLVLSISNVR